MADTASNATLRSPLGRVRGLGSAKSGTHHWWMQRLTSMALLPLTIWFAISIATLSGATYADVVAWIARPLNAVLLLLSIGLSFHHAASGLQVVIEDYASTETSKITGVLLVKAACWVLGLLAAISVLKIAI